MNAISNPGRYRMSIGYARTVVGHRKAMGLPMIGCRMGNDPLIGDPANEAKTAAGALRERRACQYAAAMGRKSGALPIDQSAMRAVWHEENATVYFFTRGARGVFDSVYSRFSIPAHVMEFDVDRDVALLEACPETDDMFGPVCAVMESEIQAALDAMFSEPDFTSLCHAV